MFSSKLVPPLLCSSSVTVLAMIVEIVADVTLIAAGIRAMETGEEIADMNVNHLGRLLAMCLSVNENVRTHCICTESVPSST